MNGLFVVTGSPGTFALLTLWLGLVVAITTLRVAARYVAGLISPPERCVILGGRQAFDRLRAKLDDDPAESRFIETVWGVGYRFRP